MSPGESAPAPELRPPPQSSAPPRSGSSRAWLFRGLILAVVLDAVGLIWWSFGLVLAPRQKQSRELSLKVARLSSEVDDLDRQWTPAQMAQVTNQFSRVNFALFQGRAGVENWLANLKELAASLALDVKTDFGQPSLQTVGGRTLTLIPATVSIDVRPAGPDTKPPSPYERVLMFGQLLAAEKKRADLAELTVDGGANSISRVVLVLNHWTGKEGPP
jgi:hypothetical protein